VDYEVRWCMLKLADLLVRPVEEQPPTVRIHLPPTPVTETAPPLPTPKIAVKPPVPPAARAIKSGGPLKGSPVVAPPKLKLPANSVSLDGPRSALSSRAGTPKTSAAPPLPEAARPKIALVPSASSASVASKGKNKKPANKPPSAKATPKAQSNKMSPQEVILCRNALRKLMQNKHAALFKKPVDPIRDQAPKCVCFLYAQIVYSSFYSSYFDIIKKPMDLSTMSAKIEMGIYKHRSEFQADFRLMIENCKTYNSAGTYVHNEAIAFETFFEKRAFILLCCALWHLLTLGFRMDHHVQNAGSQGSVAVCSRGPTSPCSQATTTCPRRQILTASSAYSFYTCCIYVKTCYQTQIRWLVSEPVPTKSAIGGSQNQNFQVIIISSGSSSKTVP